MDMPGRREAHLRPPPTCARCRGRLNRGHKFDETCAEPRPPNLPPLPAQSPSNWRLHGRGRALHPLESGPTYAACPHFRGTPDAVISAARNAMHALAASPTKYRGVAEATPTSAAHATGPSTEPSSFERDHPVAAPPAPITPPAPRTREAPPPHGLTTTGHTPDSPSPDTLASRQPGPRPTQAPSGQMPLPRVISAPSGPSCPTSTTLPTPPQLASALRRSLAETADAGRAGSDRNEQAHAPPLARLPNPRDAAPPIEPFEIPFPDDLAASSPGLFAALAQFEARLVECGATSYSPSGEWLQNQCLYLCLAAATSSTPEHIHQLAQTMRNSIEGAVRRARPNWATTDFLGEEVGAFSDFLIWGIPHTSALQERAVAVFDSRTGTCEIFCPNTPAGPRSPVLALWFSGAHYRWVQWAPPGPSLPELLTALLNEAPLGHRVPTILTHTQP